MAEAYRRLPEHVKEQIAGLRARHSIEASFGAAMPMEQRHALHERFPDAEHPVVRTHPETGEKVLFVNAFTTHFTNFHTPENVRFGFDYAPGRERTAQLPDPPGRRPRVPGPLALDEEQLRDLGQPLHPALRRPGLLARRPQDGARRDRRRQHLLITSAPSRPIGEPHAFPRRFPASPRTRSKLVITAAPYGPEWEPARLPEDIPLTMDEHVQQAVDCCKAGATVLHIHVRELDGKGSKRLSKFNELLRRLREAVPDMILQVGGSISFAPEGEDGDAKWLSDDTRHMLAELDPKPDQVTIAINTSQMNIVELMTDDDIAGTSFERPELYEAYRNMAVPAGPEWVEEHLRRLTANGIQPHFQLAHSAQLETVERLVRRGVYTGPLNITWVSIGGGFDGPNPYTMMEFIRRVPDGASLTLESIMRNVLPINTMAIAMGLHPRCGNEDTLWGRSGEKLHLGRRRPAAGPHRRRARPRGRHRQGSPRHLPARRVLGQRRRGPGQARLRAQPPARPARLHSTTPASVIAFSASPVAGAGPVPPGPHLRPLSTANHAFEVDPSVPSPTGAGPRHRIAQWSVVMASLVTESRVDDAVVRPAPTKRPHGSSRGSSSPSPSVCCCRTTCPGRSSPPSSPSSSWNGR